MQAAGLLLAGYLALAASGGQPALADCTQNGVNVNCAPPGTGGFSNSTPGGDGLTVTVQPGTTVVDDGNNAIRVRDGNTITNNGAIQATGAANGIRGRDNNSVTNNGTINVVNGAAIWLDDMTAQPLNPNVINNGTIAASGFGAGLFLGQNHNVANYGTISVGAGGFGISTLDNNLINNYGSIIASGGFGATAVELTQANNILNNYGLIRSYGDFSTLALEVCGCASNTQVNNYGTMDGNISVDGVGNKLTNYGLMTVTDPNIPIGFGFFGGNFSFIGNSFEQMPSGTLALRMDQFGDVDLLVADTITLAGTLRIKIQQQLYQNQTVSFAPGVASFADPIITTFSRYTASSPFFTVTPIYDTGDPAFYFELFVQLDRIPFGSVPGLNKNQQAIGNALESFYSPNWTGNAATLYGEVLAANSITVLDQISGQGVATAQPATLTLGSMFNNLMQSLGLNGDNSVATSVIVPASQYAPTPAPRGSDAFASLRPPAPDAAAPGRWRIWTLGFGSSRSVDADATLGTAAQSIHGAGGALGFDQLISPDLLLGFSAGGSEANFSAPALLTTGQISGGHVGLYGVKTWGSAYAAATLSYGRFSNTTTRNINLIVAPETAAGRFDSDLFSGRVELGWKQPVGRFTVTPFAAIEPAALHTHGFTENSIAASGAPGVFGLTFAPHTTTSLPTFLGAQVDTRWALADGTLLAPYLRASWVHEFEPSRQVTASFVSIPGTSFTVDGARPASNSARLDGGAKLTLGRNVSLFTNLTGEWSNVSRSYAAIGGIRYIQ